MGKKLFGTLLPLLLILLLSAKTAPAGLSPAEKAEQMLALMTIDEKIGQMTQPDRQYLKTDTDIEKYGFGSLLSGGGSAPKNNTPKGWADMTDGYQKHALSTRLKIPMLYGADAVHGHNNVPGATIFPHNIAMGATGSVELVKAVARATAIEAAATGVYWTFAPCVAVAQDMTWGRTYESYGRDTDLVSAMGVASIEGFQGKNLSAPDSILATVKHFAGDGGTLGGIDQGDTRVTEDELMSVHVKPYAAAIKAGARSIMVSFSSWNGVKMHGNKYLLTDVLKGKMGFTGFLVSDWKAIDQLPGSYPDQIEASINAGLDMIMVPDRYEYFILTMKGLVNKGRIPVSRIDDAVKRILTVKYEMGLFEHPMANRGLLSKVGSKAHRELARECVRRSLIVLKKNDSLFPLSKKYKKIMVVGKSADDVGMQCGGWTISWQGQTGDIPGSTSFLTALKAELPKKTEVLYSYFGEEAVPADIGIAVIGEPPYAEYQGENTNRVVSEEDLMAVKNLKKQGMPLIVIYFSGRPMDLSKIEPMADVIIAAWLPGTEGQGVTDVLFGKYPAGGKSTQPWGKL